MKPQLERLETRDCPSSVNLVNGLATVQLTGGGVHTASVSVDGQTVTVDGQAQSIAGATSLVLLGSPNGKNIIENNSALPATIVGGRLADVLFGGGGNDVIVGGRGGDAIYDLLGVNTIDSTDGVMDRVFTSAASAVAGDGRDRIVSFFAAGRGPNSSVVSLENGVLYLTPPATGSRTVLTGDSRLLTMTTDWAGTRTFQGVQQIAYFGGSGNDTYINATAIDDVAYGFSGNDLLIGGQGKFSLMKGSGGSDTLIGRAKVSDLSGGPNVGDVDLLFALAGRRNVFRVDAADQVFGAGLTISPGT